MRMTHLTAAIVLALGLSSVASAANQPARTRRAGGQNGGLGSVSFPISCVPSVQSTFNKGVALLHSFQYEQAEQTFSQVAQDDPQCAMAYWGEAMSLYHQLWDWPNADTLKQGFQDTVQAQKLRAKTDRERMYIVAAGVFFQDNPTLTQAKRVKAYSDWMGRIFTKYPDDVNAGAFYALSLITLQGTKADELANRKQAIAILDKLFAGDPNNPGVVHYLIHATDTPELAPQGLEAARRYEKLAPDSSHALHMPSHIFVRLGMWQDSIESNLAAEAAAARATEAHQGNQAANYQIHAMDFLDYSYLQSGQASKAGALVDELKNVPGASAQEIADNQEFFAARNAMELHQWKEAAQLPVAANPENSATTYWARAIGAARSGDAEGAGKDLDQLQKMEMAQQGQAAYGLHFHGIESIGYQEAAAWVDFAKGDAGSALKRMRDAAAKEEANGVDSLAIPAREMLADMLLEMKRPAEALAQYKAALAESPNRFDSLYGAAQAAQASGSSAQAHKYYSKLVEICGPGADRPELEEARTELARK